MNSDLRHATYEEIVEFVFDHFPAEDVDDKWYWKLDVDVRDGRHFSCPLS